MVAASTLSRYTAYIFALLICCELSLEGLHVPGDGRRVPPSPSNHEGYDCPRYKLVQISNFDLG